ncbi:sacsin-like [Protobothrops mucrosquamatus]|uniref:sacsin-like n=1 Tax=Protobothrops mucrosquamatus TaxID=103944 RepID=UPI0010FB755C|nr:sacsin-like [Protobothrops mucrosquamatus]
MSQKEKKKKGFRQKPPPILKYLQGILRKYPDGGQILKELIQNADDAVAEEVILLYDERSFGTQSLFSDGLASTQGPALLAYNNGIFSEDDWEGIKSPGISHKEDDPSTVGRFGLGFNSVYHITDFPSILSGEFLGVLDTQQTALEEGGQLWSIEEWEEASDQFQPFWATLDSLGKPCPAVKGHFPGTLFRFPIRQSPSKISDNIYSAQRVQELLRSFLNDAPICLLFLRNIQKVTLGIIGSDGAICELLKADVSTRPYCESNAVQDMQKTTKTNSCIKTLALQGSGVAKATSCEWLILSAEAKKNALPGLWDLAEKVRSTPALSLAYCLQDRCTGRLSCVLPLPATEENVTGLPLHISAPFQLTDDRRHVQWSEEGSQARGAEGRWNHLLMEEVLPVAYCQTVVLASSCPGDPYGAWPNPTHSQQLRYKPLVTEICQRLRNMKLLLRVGEGDPRLLHPSEAILLPKPVLDKPVGPVLEKALLLAGSPLAAAPPHVRQALVLGAKDGTVVQEATARFVRGALQHAANIWNWLTESEKKLLLEYLVEDGCYLELKDLPLLPTANGHYTCFGDAGETVFVENPDFPRILLPGLANQFLTKDLTPVLLNHLQEIAKKGLFKNLVSLNQAIIEKNLPRALPKGWVSSKSVPVIWRPSAYPSEPPLEWISAFWTFLTHRASSLEPFEGCPIIPLTPLHNSLNGIQLAQLLPQPTLIFQRHNGQCLPDAVAKILEVLGCTVIQKWDSSWSHHQLKEYVLEPTPSNVLQVFVHLGVANVTNHLTFFPTCQIESLSAFLSTAVSFSQKDIGVLTKLPLFFKMPSLLPPSKAALVSAQDYLALEKTLVPPVPTNLLTPEPVLLCRNEAERSLLFKIRRKLLGTPDLCLLCVRAMKKGSYGNRAEDAKQFMLWLLRNGDTLFSQSQELQALCHDLPFVDCGSTELLRPCHLYDPENRTLLALLRPSHFPKGPFQEQAVLRILRTLGLKSDLSAVSPADAITAAREVAVSETATAKAKSQALIRVCNESPLLSRLSPEVLKQLRSLPWVPAINSSKLGPAGVFLAPESIRSVRYAGLVGQVMGLTDAFSAHAAEELGLERLPPPEKVMENLADLVQTYCSKETPLLTAKLCSIYQHMQQHLFDFQYPPTYTSVWNGKGFSWPTDVVLTFPNDLDFALLMPQVPPDFQEYRQLFAKWGVQQSPSEEDVDQALHKLAQQINARPNGGTQAELLLFVAALDWLSNQGYHGEEEMLIPVQIVGLVGFALRPASSALYCDMDRARLADLGGDLPILVHEAVSSATAAFFGVEMLSTKLSGLELFEAWGPSEPITLRIRNILREYSQDADVFQELLQNAEDAGAQTCRFLIDLRQHDATKGLLDPGMATCQGPALWAQNDALFTEADFSNIIQLGAATKEHQEDKIGRFGLGFCTVYHMTDVPFLLSGHTVLIFDPNITHLQKHIRGSARPGIRLNLTSTVAASFPEQFWPFRGIFGCRIGEKYQGTLIRLPFRTEQEAKESQICPEPFGPSRIKGLETGFQETSQYLLVFLHNVREVSLSYLAQGSSFPDVVQPLATVSREVLNEIGFPLIRLRTTWQSAVTIHHFLLHACSADGEAEELFRKGRKGGIHFLPPFARVALPLRPSTTVGRWLPDIHGFKGRVFCFLPLPIESGLPLHLTAPFAVLSNRKGLWDTTEKGQWNIALLRDSVTAAWLGALTQFRDMYKQELLEDYKYYDFWPDIYSTKYPFTEAAKAFYQALIDGVNGEQPVLFSDGQKWRPLNHACILDDDIICKRQLSSIAARAFSLLLPEPQIAVSLPEKVKLSFKTWTPRNSSVLNTYNWARFLQELALPNLAKLAVPDRNALILRALDMNDAGVNECLKSLPCIPATPDETLKTIKELVHPEGRVAPLYCPEDGCFPMVEEFLKPERLLRLEHLGMTKDWVAMEELISRARTVEALWHQNPDKACQRVCCILGLLDSHLQESSRNTTQVLFRDIPFLPAVLPGNMHKICCPSEIYYHKLNSLVHLIEPILDKEALGGNSKLSEEIMEFLGVKCKPSVTTVLKQLEIASFCSNALSKKMLAKIAQDCYAFLNDVVRNKESRVEIAQKAQMFPFILVSVGFVPVCKVSHNLAFDAIPYLFKLPEEYWQQKDLWKCIGLRDVFTLDDYASVLEALAEDTAGRPLSVEKLEIVLRLITAGLAGVLPENQQLDSYLSQKMFFPDQDKVLRQLPKLLFDDTPWLPRESGIPFCHSMIPREIAVRCSISTKKHRILSKQRIQKLSLWGTDFGAKEDSCTRLSNILQEYPSSQDVLKELLQNADDAGASVIHFLWDRRQHPTERVFSDEWKSLQGPALCIYNNQTFQMSDIEGIQRLGHGGKRGRRDATGKYGLGFNTVYHLTDCPAFVTGDRTLCVFDPTLRYLPESDEISPGAKYNLTKDFREAFLNVYDTFLPDVFELEQGTLFRLPLRTPAGENPSPICQKSVSEIDMENMLEALKEDAECLMMFLNHIRTVIFSVMGEEDRKPKELLRVETEGGEPGRLEYQKHLQQAAAAGGLEMSKPVTVFYKMKVSTNLLRDPSIWWVGRQIGMDSTETIEGMLLPYGGVAVCLNRQVCGKAFCTLPLPGRTGLPIHVNGNFDVDSARRDLRKYSGEGDVNSIWNRLLMQYLLAPLYGQLLKNLCQTLGREPLKFHTLQKCHDQFACKYLQYFPIVTKDVSPVWQQLVTHLYKLMHKDQLPLLPVYQKNVNYKNACRIETISVCWSAPKEEHSTRGPYFLKNTIEDKILERTLQELGMSLVPAFEQLQEIHEQFVMAEMDVLTLDSPSLCQFLKSLLNFLPCSLNQTPVKNRSNCFALLTFSLSGLCSDDVNCVEGLPLLLTNDNVLRYFSQQEPVYQKSSASDLFPHRQHCFSAFADYNLNQLLLEMEFLKKFTLDESVAYIQEMLTLDSWGNDSKRRKSWLGEVWKFFESHICVTQNQEKRNELFAKLISLFKGCTLLPVYGSSMLIPLESLGTLIPNNLSPVCEILDKLGFAKLDKSLLPPELTAYCINPELLKIEDPIVVLEQLSTHSSLCWNKLDPFDYDLFLRFLCEDLEKLNNQALLAKLKALPVFETYQEKHVSLVSYDKVYRLVSKNPKLCENFLELYEMDARTVLLKDTYWNQRLSKCFGFGEMNDLQQFMLLLPRIPSLPEAKVLEALKLLFNIMSHYDEEYETQKAVVVSTFKSFAFIRDEKNVLRLVSYFYQDNTIFQELGLSSRFVPEKFYGSMRPIKKWEVNMFLLDVGLQKVISEEDFLKCATQVEREAFSSGSTSENVRGKSKALLEYLFSRAKDELSNSFWAKLSKIRFLVPRLLPDKLCSLHLPYVPCRAPVAPRGSLYCSKNVALFWTSAVAFSFNDYVGDEGRDVLKKLGVICTVPTEVVLENLSNVCQVTCDTLENKKTRAEVLKCTYRFLSEQEEIDVNSLKGLPVILTDDNEVAEAENVVVHLQHSNDFRPYLYMLPSKLGVYIDVFEKFGVQTEPTIYHYASVLARIQEETTERMKLQANLTKAVLRATQFLFHLLEETKESVDFSKLQELYLPCIDGKLYPSNTLVFSFYQSGQEPLALKNTLRFLVDLSECSISVDKYKQWKLLRLLPENLRPKYFNNIVEEQLEESSLKLCMYREYCEFQNSLKELLVSLDFQNALIALLKWQSKTEEIEDINEGLFSPDQLEVVCCEKLCIVMVYKLQLLEETECVKTVHVATMPDGKTKIYLTHQESMSRQEGIHIFSTLAIEVNKLLGERLQPEAMGILMEILACERPKDTAGVLEKRRVPLYQQGNLNAYDLPPPGEDIPEEWYDSLDMSILHTFMKGDYVGYLDSSQPKEHYLYAVVLEVLESQKNGAGQIHTYRIDLGGGRQEEVTAYDLYHFKRNKPVSDSNKMVVLAAVSADAAQVVRPDINEYWHHRPLSEVKKEIDACLDQVWRLSEEEKKKALRRLYLCYHPDKNLGQEDSANELFKYLKEKIKEMEKGMRSNGSCGGSKSSNSYHRNFSDCWSEWDRQAHQHQQRHYEFTRGGGGGGGGGSYNFWSYHRCGPNSSRSQPNHCFLEAKRWLRQAECDLKVAESIAGNGSTEWLLYMTFRAMEKTLTAVEYNQGGGFERNLSLAKLADKAASYGCELAKLPEQIDVLREHGVDDKITQYPKYHTLPTIPNEAFSACKEQDVLLSAWEILNVVKRWLGL